ncbi:hypothetical protein Nepgr_014671 [Nepenthes gracilis]|uniref:Uncharacterized protein n=1 Tax=Nepenthes gracilis TaxID=150966 RepID=A0AAD3SJP0_NEPGR|nr:hypothetical protein Nepgr_014671 [Nepenthes gracilis]
MPDSRRKKNHRKNQWRPADDDSSGQRQQLRAQGGVLTKEEAHSPKTRGVSPLKRVKYFVSVNQQTDCCDDDDSDRRAGRVMLGFIVTEMLEEDQLLFQSTNCRQS